MVQTPLPERDAALGALVHRLASPLGAVRNYAHLVAEDEDGVREALVNAVDSTGRVLDEARAWLSAGETLEDAPAQDGVSLREALGDAGADLDDTRVAGPAAAVRRVFEGVLTEAGSAAAAPNEISNEGATVRVVQRGRPASELESVGVFELFGRRDHPSHELAIAAALAERMGGRVWAESDDGDAVVCVLLPEWVPPTDDGGAS